MFTVAIYLIDRAYGGPEEGGWWYEHGEPAPEHCDHTRGFANEEAAIGYAAKLTDDVCPLLNVGRPPIHSVSSCGRYVARAIEGNPAAYPATRPHYE